MKRSIGGIPPAAQRVAEVGARAAILAFFVLTSLCFLLYYIPFTYEQVFRGNVFPPIIEFTKLHSYLYLGVVAAAVWLFRAEWNSNTPLAATLGIMAGSGLIFLVRPVFAGFEGGDAAFPLSLLALAPPLLFAVLSGLGPQRRAATLDSERAFHAAWQSGLAASLVSAGIAFSQGGLAPNGAPALGWSLLSHVVLALALFLPIEWIRVAAAQSKRSGRVELLLTHSLIAAGLWLALRTALATTLTFSGSKAEAYCALFGLTVAAYLTTFRGSTQSEPEPGSSNQAWLTPALVLGVAVFEVVAIGKKDTLDWNFLFHKVTAGVVWLALFLVLYRRPLMTFRLPAKFAVGVVALVALGYRGLQALPAPTVLSSEALDHYAGYDASFHLLRDMLAPPKASSDTDFYRYLSANTNVPRSVAVQPAEVNLVPALARTGGDKPNIFIFTVDSLRRDYISTYNPKVDFTPRIGEFAKDAVVFENPITHYGGTGLSEPSIWVGGLMFHKQYVQPFAPMNSLEKLAAADGYREIVSKDSILSNIMDPKRFESGDAIEIDKDHRSLDYDFCTSVEQLKPILSARADRPSLVYVQPQNIHISVIQHAGAKSIDGHDYGSFYAPYASRLARVDGCFGDFIQFLKARNLYDNSLIVLTADHGDSLGEEGRWGHAYTIYAEILKIPLLVHLPKNLQRDLAEGKLVADTKSPVFTTDITPSLYYLLGHGASTPSPLTGRPLFTATEAERKPYARDSYFIAASYGPVYGSMSADARHMYVSDAAEYKDYELDLSSPRAQSSNEADKKKGREKIKSGIDAIAKLYNFGARPAPNASAAK